MNGLYEKAKEKFLGGEIDMIADDIKCVLVDTATYSVDLTADEFLSSIPVGERVSTSANLANKTRVNGVFDADDTEFTSVTGDISEAIVIYKDTGDAATSPLILYIDQATGLVYTPDGTTASLTWDAQGIFKL